MMFRFSDSSNLNSSSQRTDLLGSNRRRTLRQRLAIRTRYLRRAALFAFLSLSANSAFAQLNNNVTLDISTDGAVADAGDIVNEATGIINFNGPGGTATLSSGTNVIDNEGQINVIDGGLNVTGNVTNLGTGTISLGANAGLVDVTGTLTQQGTSSLSITAGTLTINGQTTHSSTNANGFVVGAAGTFVTDDLTNSSGATITNSGSITSGTSILNSGTINSNTATSDLQGGLTNSNIVNARNLIGGAVVNDATGEFNVTGALAGDNTFTNSNALNLNGGNFTGITTLSNSGTVTIGNGFTLSANAINNTAGTIAVGTGSTLSGLGNTLTNDAAIDVATNGSVTDAGDINNNATGTINFNGPGGTSTLSSGTNVIANAGVINLNAGTVTVTGNVTGAGSINIADTATLQSGLATQSIANDIVLGGGTASVDSNGNAVTISGDISGTGALSKLGTGTLVLSGTNTHSGTTTVSAGTVTLENGAAIADAGAVVIGAAGTLKVADSETVGSIAGVAGSQLTIDTGATLTAGGDNTSTTYAGSITGDGALTKAGTGTLTLSGAAANTFAGGLNVNGGTVAATTNNQLGTGAVQFSNTSTLQVDVGTTQTVASLTTGTDSTVNNSGTITSTAVVVNNGDLNNLTAASVLNGGVNNNDATAVINNTGTINGGVTANLGTINSNTATSSIQGGLTNSNIVNARNLIGGAVVNDATGEFNVTGALTGDNTFTNSNALNLNGGNFTGITTLNNSGTVTIGNGFTLSANVINNTAGTISVGTGSTLSGLGNTLTNDATINVATNGSVTDAGDINNNASGTINFNGPGGTSTLSSGTNVIANAGVINLNAGTVAVTGNVSGAGTMNLANGSTLRSGSASQTIANAMTVTGATTIDNNGNDVTASGNITGAGSITKSGTGNLVLSGTNTFGGGMTVSAGTVTGTTTSLQGAITNNATVAIDQNVAGTFAGSISGTGGVNKLGTGEVTFSGNNTYTGATTVTAGTLRIGSAGNGSITSNVTVGANGTLGGGGTITGNVTNTAGGRIEAGNSIGTLTVNGNFNSSNSTIENELNATTSDLIDVSGTANITGATLQNVFDPAPTYGSRVYRVLEADGGVTGQFATVTNTNAPAGFLVRDFYTANTANVAVLTINDLTLPTAVTGSLLTSGQDYTTSLMNQLHGVQFGGLGMKSTSLEPDVVMQDRPKRHLWFKGIGMFNDTDADGAIPGYDANTGGGMMGYDHRVDKFGYIGLALGFTSTDVDVDDSFRSNASIDSPRVSIYGARTVNAFTLAGILGYGFHNVETERVVTGAGTILGDQTQHELAFALQGTYQVNYGNYNVLPFAGIQYLSLSQDDYLETGVVGLNMNVLGDNQDSFRPYLGAGVQRLFVTSGGMFLMPQFFTRYSYETNDDSNVSRMQLGTTQINVVGVGPSQHILSLGGGINAQMNNRLDLFANYNVDLGESIANHTFGTGLLLKF